MKLKNLILAILLSCLPLNNAMADLNKQNNTSKENPNLISPETKVDYNPLAELLSKGQWRKANDETRHVLMQATGREQIGWVPTEDIKKLSCWDLKTIDDLWVKYSNGRFGLSVQLPIYIETGNRPGKLITDDAYTKFGDRLGWRYNGDWIIFIEKLNYTLDAPMGHLPNPRPEYSITGGRLQYSTLAQRMVQCKIGTTENVNNQ
jgi:hypothetical protein